MAEYNKVMTQIKPDLPKVIDTEQIYVYVPKAAYDQAGIVKPDSTQFVIAGDYTLSIKHFEMTEDHVSVDVKMGYKNDTALNDLDSDDFVTKDHMTGYAVTKLVNDTGIDKVYVEGANRSGTKLVSVSDDVLDYSIVKRNGNGRIFANTSVIPTDKELVNSGHVNQTYVKKSGNANRVYTTDNTGADSSAQFSNNAIANTMAYRAYDGSLRGEVTEPIDTTLLNDKYVREHYIPVGSDGKIPDSYLPASLGNDEIVSGYYFEGKFYLDEEHTQLETGSPDKLYVDLATNLTYRYDEQAGYVLISSSLALGTTHSTAFYGDYGKVAYDHANSVGNPHETQIEDISGLRDALDSAGANNMSVPAENTKDSLTLINCSNSTNGVMHLMYANSGNYVGWYLNDTGYSPTPSDIDIQTGDVVKIVIKPGLKLFCGTEEVTTNDTIPCGWLQFWTSGTVATSGSNVTYTITIGSPTKQGRNVLCSSTYTPSTVVVRGGRGCVVTAAPNDDLDSLNLAYWKANYKPFNYTTVSALSSVDDGFNVEYQVNGNAAEIEIPMKGTDDIVVDIDEANKMINVHLDAAVRAKLAKTLVLPTAAPSTTSLVGITTNNAQSILTEQESRDAIGVFKMVSMTQDEYNNLGTKDSKTLYLITG